jgi:peptidoglycan/LPS O-acetylase OafA/YrhL
LEPRSFYKHLHAFRGFAILNIVAAHCWTTLMIIATQDNINHELRPLSAVSETLFHNATIYFAVISGLLFSLILKKYSWKKFYLSKVKNVLAPYIVFSVIFAFLSGLLIVAPGTEPLTANDVINKLPMHIITGSSFAHMWYVPVLIVLFLLTPVFNVVVTNKKLLPILVVILLAPLFVSRSWPDFVWENFVFFFGPYVFGICLGNNYIQVHLLIEKYKSTLWFVALSTTAILGYLYLIEYESILGIQLQESIGYIQKLSICFIVLNFMQRNEIKSSQFLSTLGDYSFSIYFVHMFFVVVFGFIMIYSGLTPPNILGIFLSGFLLLPLTILVSMGFTWLIKKAMGKYSRLVIGS